MRPRLEQPVVTLIHRTLHEHGPCTNQDLSKYIGIAPRNIRSYTKLLVEVGQLKVVGRERMPNRPGPLPELFMSRQRPTNSPISEAA